MASEKEKFDCWTASLKKNLESQYADSGFWVDWEKLTKGRCWGQLWEIFRRNTRPKERHLDDEEAESVILAAHGKSYSELESNTQMQHYMNSSNYD
uniref:hypothetical protein n=1 Tax=Trichocoleus desertorum TaxID=1481672 RepID=UPI0025B2F463|nr:hypothetical protein [Trichocoleus desertorum]